MKIKQKIVVVTTTITLSLAAVFLPSGSSLANTVSLDKFNHQLDYPRNYLVKYIHDINQQLMSVQSVQTESFLDNLIPCLHQERSPFDSSIELLMRLFIIGSFGSVGIMGYSSFVERYVQIINKDLKILYYSIFLLMSLQIIVSVVGMMSSSASPIFSAIRPNSSCILGNP